MAALDSHLPRNDDADADKPEWDCSWYSGRLHGFPMPTFLVSAGHSLRRMSCCVEALAEIIRTARMVIY